MFKGVPAAAAMVKGIPTAGVVALPSTAMLSGAGVPWYAWLAISLASLGVVAWRMYLLHRNYLEWLRLRGKENDDKRTIAMETLTKMDKLPAEHASLLMATITGLSPNQHREEPVHGPGESEPTPPDLPDGAP